jgi:hypothetical protein
MSLAQQASKTMPVTLHFRSLMPKYKVFGFQRSPRPEQINLQRSLIDGTINRFAGVSQLFWVCDRDRGATEARTSFAQQALNILRLVEVLGGLEPDRCNEPCRY